MDNLRGILLMTFSMLVFAIEDSIIKAISDDIPISQIILILGLLGTLAFGVICHHRGLNMMDRAFFSRPILIRSGCESIGTLCFVMAIVYTPLSLASAIFQMTPLVVTFGAAIFLREKVGWRRWSATCVGLIGVLIMIRPGLEGFEPLSIFAVFAAVFLGGRDLATRVIPRNLPSLLIAFWGFFIIILTGLALLPFDAPWIMPDASQWIKLFAACVMGVTGYYAITAAMRVGDVAVVTPFRYSRMIFALIFGMVIFDERPDIWIYIGAIIVVLSGLYTLMREARVRRRETP